MLSINGLSASYATGVPVLKNVSVEVPAGQFVAIVGPNGAVQDHLRHREA